MFGTWLWRLDKDKKSLVLAGVVATCRVIWCCCNDVVFDQKVASFPSQIIYSAIHILASYMDYSVEAWHAKYYQSAFLMLMSVNLVFGLDTTRV
jgi:hypothetical protein